MLSKTALSPVRCSASRKLSIRSCVGAGVLENVSLTTHVRSGAGACPPSIKLFKCFFTSCGWRVIDLVTYSRSDLVHTARDHPVGRHPCYRRLLSYPNDNFDFEQQSSNMGAGFCQASHEIAMGCDDISGLVDDDPGQKRLLIHSLGVKHLHTYTNDSSWSTFCFAIVLKQHTHQG